jgi:signal transduction histidine kinase
MVEQRTAQLQDSLRQLSATIKDLKDTQRKLVEQEKMASLGGLVAGVAHEINTPIGVAITASSHLAESIAVLNKAFTLGQLTKTSFRENIDDMGETTQMVLKNLERAAAQVRSFKMVAVDQSNEDAREFNLHEYIDTVIMSLRPRLKRTQHVIKLDVPGDLVLVSFPGVYSQIFTNLIMNSLIHGFDGIDNGTIIIQARRDDNDLKIDYYDDGRGIPEPIKARIFEPFVTTNRHRGGTGLGTHIVYNLVTQVLKGRIELVADSAQGVHFAMVIPAHSVVGYPGVSKVNNPE